MQEMGLKEQVGVQRLRVGEGHSELGQQETVGPRQHLACGEGRGMHPPLQVLLCKTCSAHWARGQSSPFT